MADQQDTPMSNADAVADTAETADRPTELALSDDERRVLELYDQLKAQQLDIAVLEAQKSYTGDSGDNEALQSRLLSARAAYILRNEVIDSVLTVNPVLKAVHGATTASPIERDLLPLVEQRDAVSQGVARQATERRALRDERAAVAADSRQVEQQNAVLAAELRTLVADKERREAAGADQEATPEKARLEAEVKASRQRWKLIKGAASAIVAGSGVDWARDAALRDIVMDPE